MFLFPTYWKIHGHFELLMSSCPEVDQLKAKNAALMKQQKALEEEIQKPPGPINGSRWRPWSLNFTHRTRWKHFFIYRKAAISIRLMISIVYSRFIWVFLYPFCMAMGILQYLNSPRLIELLRCWCLFMSGIQKGYEGKLTPQDFQNLFFVHFLLVKGCFWESKIDGRMMVFGFNSFRWLPFSNWQILYQGWNAWATSPRRSCKRK